jgi:acyl dehydratase
MSARVVGSLEELETLVGSEVGVSDWVTIDQDRVDLFAEATGDHQWIHVDPERAASSPFGGTIVHGYLTLSLIPSLMLQIMEIGFGSARLNYGLNSLRFPAPVRTGTRVRLRSTVAQLRRLPKGDQLTMRHTVEREGEERPGCVAEGLTLILP